MRLYFYLLVFFLMPFSALAWEGDNDSQANLRAHDAANCITLGSAKLDKIAKISGAALYDKKMPSEACDQLINQWHSSGLTRDDASLLADDKRERRVYLSQDNKWRIEFCSFHGILRNESECEIIPSSYKGLQSQPDPGVIRLMHKLNSMSAESKKSKLDRKPLNKFYRGTVQIEVYENGIRFSQGDFEKEFQKPDSSLSGLYSISTPYLDYKGVDGVIDTEQSKGVAIIPWNKKISSKDFPLFSFFNGSKTAIGILSSHAGATGRSSQELLLMDTISNEHTIILGHDLEEPNLIKE